MAPAVVVSLVETRSSMIEICIDGIVKSIFNYALDQHEIGIQYHYLSRILFLLHTRVCVLRI